LQKDLEQPRAANLILIKENESKSAPASRPTSMREILRDTCALEDLGVKLRVLDAERGIALESTRGVISNSLYSDAMSAASEAGVRLEPILSYLANSIRIGQREVPYSVITGLGPESFEALRKTGPASDRSRPLQPASIENEKSGETTGSIQELPPILLNDWAGTDLLARPGDTVTLEYYIWEDQGVLSTRTAGFRLAGVVPMKDQAAGRYLGPDYPRITTTQNHAASEPP